VDLVSLDDERRLTFLGFLTFLDPPKAGVDRVIADLATAGIGLRMITGDNRLAAAQVAAAVGIDPGRLPTGAEIDRLDDRQLVFAAQEARVFAEVDPLHKERVIQALRSSGAVVGYLGDGINDAGALHLADVGISVDTAVDVAKSAAAIVLLDKDLGVLLEGVRLGRQTFANTLKYVFTTVSANFGNMASMAAASAVLPFLPLLPRQILVLNFLSDIPSATIAADRVDPEQRQRPQRWDLRFIRDFMVAFGLLSSGFDLLTFAVLLQLFHAGPELFRTGWFVGSTLTELAVLLVLRTRRPALRSRPGTGLLVSSIGVAVFTVSLPYVPWLAEPLALVPLPATVLGALGVITLSYVVAAEAGKRRFYRAVDRPRPTPPSGRHPRRLLRVVREHGGTPAMRQHGGMRHARPGTAVLVSGGADGVRPWRAQGRRRRRRPAPTRGPRGRRWRTGLGPAATGRWRPGGRSRRPQPAAAIGCRAVGPPRPAGPGWRRADRGRGPRRPSAGGPRPER
jgi:Mg2+-importing ATPase